MPRLLTLVALGLVIAFAPTPGEAASKRIHVIAKVVQQTFTGDLGSPKLGDRIINNVDLFDDSGTKVGAGAGACTIVSIEESSPDTLVQCLLSAVFDEGQIILGGLAPFPEAGVVGYFGILGGTDAFHKARGDATLVVLSNGDIDTILDLE
jgi:Allene oxide cyclase barrel like domain